MARCARVSGSDEEQNAKDEVINSLRGVVDDSRAALAQEKFLGDNFVLASITRQDVEEEDERKRDETNEEHEKVKEKASDRRQATTQQPATTNGRRKEHPVET